MGRQSRITNERRANSNAAWVAFSPHLTRQAMGAARLAMSRTDVETIEEMVSTASPAAHAYFEVWDEAGMGVTMETAAYDIACMSAHAISDLRAGHPSLVGVFTTVDVLLGDWDVSMRVTQAGRGGDVVAQIVDAHLHTWDEESGAMSDFLAKQVKRGVHVMAFMNDGTMVDLSKPRSTADF